MFSRLLSLLLLVGFFAPLPAAAQAVDTGHLEARLVRQTEWVPPGSTVYVAVVQDIEVPVDRFVEVVKPELVLVPIPLEATEVERQRIIDRASAMAIKAA